jgi:hypothetical protein
MLRASCFRNKPIEDLEGEQLVTDAGIPEASTASERTTSTLSPFPDSSESAPSRITSVNKLTFQPTGIYYF